MMTNLEDRSYLERIDELVSARHLLLHPFYQAWVRGELSLEALKDYARQYYRHVAAFPTYLSALHSHTEDARTRRRLLDNLMDEEAGDPNHPELWLHFAEGLGLSRQQVQQAESWEEAKQLIQSFRSLCRGGEVVEGLAALYVYESQIPAVAQSKIAGLKKFYGIEDARGLAYFAVHLEADREHSAVERELLSVHLNDRNASGAFNAADTVLNRLWDLLSAVAHRHAIA